MSQNSQDAIIKEKVLAVREVVPGRSNEQIILVLTYYDYSVNDAIQAFLEDGAKAALEEWHYPGNKPNNKKKKKKQQQKKAEQAAKDAQQAEAAAENKNTPSTKKEVIVEAESVTKEAEPPKNGPLREESNKTSESETPKEVDQVNRKSTSPPKSTSSATAATKQPSNAPKKSSEAFMERTTEATGSTTSYQRRPNKLETGSSRAARERTLSEMSVSSVASSTGGGERSIKSGKPHAGLEKSMKDLQRQTLSLQRLRLVLGEEVEKSFKTMSAVFEDLRLALNEREAELMFAMDKAKAQANETLQRRQSRAVELKVRTDRAQVMSDSELSELRADIKHFVSDRKVDEDMTKSARFVCEAEELLQQIKSFGEVSPVKHAYSLRRPSVSSVCSSVVSHDEPLTPLTPTTPVFAPTPVSSVNHSNTPSVPTSSSSPKSREVATLTEKFMSAVSLQETPPPTPSHKSASTSPQRPSPQRPIQSAPAPTTTAQLEDEECEIVRRPRNARRRQKQKLRERGQDGPTSEEGLIIPPPSPPPSNDLEKKERPASNQPKQVANRGTSPMKHPSMQSQGKASQGQNQENPRSSYRRGGQGQRSQHEGHTNQPGREQYRGQNQQDKQRHDYNTNGQMQSPRQQRERRPRSSYNRPGMENNGPRNGPLQPTMNGPTVNGAVNGDNKAPHNDTNNRRKTPDVNGDGRRKPSVEPLKETDLKLNKQDSRVAPGKRDAANNNHKLIDVGSGDNPKVGLPQRGPRLRGSRHAQENHKSQLMVNGDQAPSANGHS